jgi:hypothetical protein
MPADKSRPDTFAEEGDYSIVHHQPQNGDEIRRAYDGAGGMSDRLDRNGRASRRAYRHRCIPELIAENVYYCGFNAESSFGAWSYLVVRSDAEGGNVLVDSPRFATQLVKKIDAMGGVSTDVSHAQG